MAFVSAICPNCNGILEVDNSNDAAICKYCGTPFITEKAINVFNTNNNYNVNASVVNIYSQNQSSNAMDYFEKAKKYFIVGSLEQAYKEYTEARVCDTDNGEIIFWGMIYSRLNKQITEYDNRMAFLGIPIVDYISRFPTIQQYEIDILNMKNISGNYSFSQIGDMYFRMFFGFGGTLNDKLAIDFNRCSYLCSLNYNIPITDLKKYLADSYKKGEIEKIKFLFDNDKNKLFNPYIEDKYFDTGKEIIKKSFYNIAKRGFNVTYKEYYAVSRVKIPTRVKIPSNPIVVKLIEQYYPNN